MASESETKQIRLRIGVGTLARVMLVEAGVGLLAAVCTLRGFHHLYGYLAARIYPLSYWPARARLLYVLQEHIPIIVSGIVGLSTVVLLHAVVGRRYSKGVSCVHTRPLAAVCKVAKLLLVAACVTSMAVVVCAGGLLGADYVTRYRRASYKGTFKTLCSKCHGYSRPLGYVKSVRGWDLTVRRMQAKDPSWMSDKEALQVSSYLWAVRGFDGRDLYRAKCLPCHFADRLLSRPRPAQSWRRILERLHAKNPFVITAEEIDLIAAYIDKRASTSKQSRQAGHYDRSSTQFESTCGRCHSLKRSFEKPMSDKAWRRFLEKHRQKSPELIGEPDSLDELAAYLATMPSMGRAAFGRRFPHDD